MITYSDSTQKTVQKNVFCLFGNILNLVTKVAQTFPKSDKFLFSVQTGQLHPYRAAARDGTGLPDSVSFPVFLGIMLSDTSGWSKFPASYQKTGNGTESLKLFGVPFSPCHNIAILP